MDMDGRLQCNELLTFALESGFKGNDDIWDEEYRTICRERSLDPAQGLHEAAFAALLDDTSDAGCFVETDEIKAILERLKATRSRRWLGRDAAASAKQVVTSAPVIQREVAAEVPPAVAKLAPARQRTPSGDSREETPCLDSTGGTHSDGRGSASGEDRSSS